IYDFDQDNLGGEAILSKGLDLQSSDHLLSWGLAANVQSFDMFRDRREPDDQGVFSPQSGYPTKYFPRSDVLEVGLFLQDEIRLANGRMTLVPGIRYDLYRLDPSQTDAVYLEGNLGTPLPVAMNNDALSPRLGATFAITPETIAFAQFARGFRAPPFSEVNNGFTNVSFGYTTLPNPNLEPETSDNFEFGIRRQGKSWGGSLGYFDNRYDDFIETVTIGINPATGLLEYQPQNVNDVRIHGVELAAHGQILSWLQARSALSWSEGKSGVTDEPLNSVAPHQAVLGLRVLPKNRRWGGEINAVLTEAKDEDAIDTTIVDQFAPPSSQVVDASAFFDLSKSLRFEFSVYNATDETYWNWGAVRGIAASSPTLDRYTSPGRSVVMTLRFQR
ncbi:MAG: TonB-dependent receptor, partial [Thermoanaerobaculia bacterium]|nr:TonB-dependent receptor [Thermoanaerobaculia bacterium]